MYRKPLLILALAVSLGSCRELYDYQAETTGDYLVVEGMITDDPGPYTVTLSKAIAYSNDLRLYDYNPEKETGATVAIRSDKGEEAILAEEEGNPGTYATRAGEITGEIGHRYWLYIRTQSGSEYESWPSELMGKPDVTVLHAAAAEKQVLDESSTTGGFVTRQGMQLSCDVDNINAADYIKIDYLTFSPYHYYLDSTFYGDTILYNIDPLALDTIIDTLSIEMYRKGTEVFCWRVQQPESGPNIFGTGHAAPGNLLKDIPMGFVNQNTYFSDADTIFSDLAEVYVIQDIGKEIANARLREIVLQVFYHNYYFVDVKAYAINDTVYEYYRNLKNQTTANNKIFDPIPVALTGNIRCISDPAKSAYGIFTAASVMKKQFYVRWAGMYVVPSVENLDFYFPVESNGCLYGTEPVFWRHF